MTHETEAKIVGQLNRCRLGMRPDDPTFPPHRLQALGLVTPRQSTQGTQWDLTPTALQLLREYSTCSKPKT